MASGIKALVERYLGELWLKMPQTLFEDFGMNKEIRAQKKLQK